MVRQGQIGPDLDSLPEPWPSLLSTGPTLADRIVESPTLAERTVDGSTRAPSPGSDVWAAHLPALDAPTLDPTSSQDRARMRELMSTLSGFCDAVLSV